MKYVVLLAIVVVFSASRSLGACIGDCNANGIVTVEEAVLAVDRALRGGLLGRCERSDRDQDGVITIDELVAAVGSALNGCPPAADPVNISFLHFNDLHAHLTPHKDLVPDAPPGQTAASTKVVERGGLARLATLIRSLRRQNPDAVLMNIGDTYHGGVEALYTLGNAIVDPVNALGIDIGVPGNWDFAYGPSITRRRYTGESAPGLLPPFAGDIKRPSFPNLAANVTITLPPERAGQAFLSPTAILTVGGVKVGFIGITSDIVPMMFEQLAVGFEFLQCEDAYRDLIDRHAATLRGEGADVVVVMSELGIHKDYRLAQIIAPGSVDVFFSAHTHEATFEPLTSQSGALVVESGNDGYLGHMDITVSAGSVVERAWQLIPIDPSLPENPEIAAMVEAARAPFLATDVDLRLPVPVTGQRLTEPIDTVVAHVDFSLDRRQALESPFNDLMTDILRTTAGTQLAITPGFRFDAVIPAPGVMLEDDAVAVGEVTLEDIYRFFPVSYNIATARTTGRNVVEIIERLLTQVFSLDAFAQEGGWVDGFSGLDIIVDLSRPDGERVLSVVRSDTGEMLAPEQAVTVTGCTRPLEMAGILCAHPGFEGVAPLINPDTEVAWTPVDILLHGLNTLTVEPRQSITDESGREFWPASPFVQPLRDATL
jgi:sulfur-oxidizing protein SoxB